MAVIIDLTVVAVVALLDCRIICCKSIEMNEIANQ